MNRLIELRVGPVRWYYPVSALVLICCVPNEPYTLRFSDGRRWRIMGPCSAGDFVENFESKAARGLWCYAEEIEDEVED